MARSRLNTKFLIIVASVFGVLMLGLLFGLNYYRESTGRAVDRATAYEEVGEWNDAAAQWGRAYANTGNIAYQLNAIEALQRTVVDPDVGDDNLRLIVNAYQGLIQANSSNTDAIRGLMRLMVETGRFATNVRATYETNEVLRLADMILESNPQDAEALRMRNAAIINLAGFDGSTYKESPVTEEMAITAADTLEQLIPESPGNGTALVTYLRFRSQEIVGMLQEAADARAEFEALREWTDQLARSARDVPPDETAVATERAMLHLNISRAYRQLGRLGGALEQVENTGSLSAASGLRAGQNPELERAVRDIQKAYNELSRDQLALAVEKIDAERDGLLDDYVQIRQSYSQSLETLGQLADAEEESRALLEVRPWDVRASQQLVDILIRRGKLAEAVEVAEAAVARAAEPLPEIPGPAGQSARRWRWTLELLLSDALLAQSKSEVGPQRTELQEKAEAAMDRFEDVRVANNIRPLPRYQRVKGEIQLANGDTAAGIATLNEALRSLGRPGPDIAVLNQRYRTLAALAEANTRLGQTGAVLSNYRDMLSARGNDVRTAISIARLLQETGQVEAARQWVDNLSKVLPDSNEIAELRFTMMPEADRNAFYEQMPEETEPDLRIKLRAAMTTRRIDESIRLAERLREVSPDDQAPALVLAQQLALRDGEGDRQQALAILEQMPGNELASTLRARITDGLDALAPERRAFILGSQAIARGEEINAIESLTESLQLAQQTGNAAQARETGSLLFRVLVNGDRLDEAEDLAAQLGDMQADGMEGRSYAIRILMARGEIDRALSEAQQLVRDFPGIAGALTLEGEGLRRSGRFTEAIETYRTAVGLSPTDPEPLVGIISAFDAAGRLREARPFIDRGLQMNQRQAYFRQADQAYQLQLGDPATVIANKQAEVDASPDNAGLLLELARVLATAAQGADQNDDASQANTFLQQSVDTYEKGLAQFPEDVRFLSGLAAAVQLDGASPALIGTARAAVRQAMDPQSSPDLSTNEQAVRSSAQLEARKGDLGTAETYVRQWLSRADAPREREAAMLLVLSQLLRAQDQNSQAIAVLEGYEDVPAVLRRKIQVLAVDADATGDPAAFAKLRDEIAEAGDRVTAPMLIAAAFAEVSSGDPEVADALLARIAEMAPTDAQGIYLRGVAEAQRPGGDRAKAAELLREAAQRNTSNLDALRNLAIIERSLGNTGATEDALEQLLVRAPADVEARLGLSQLQLAKSPPDYDSARRTLLAGGAAGEGNNPRLLMARARLEAAAGNRPAVLDPGRQAVEAATEQAGPDATPLTEVVAPYTDAYLAVLLQARQYQPLLRYTEDLGDDGEETWWVQRARAIAQAELQRDDQAADSFRLALRLAAAANARGTEQLILEAARRVGEEVAWPLVEPRLPAEDATFATPAEQLQALSAVLLAAQIKSEVGSPGEAVEYAARAADLSEGIELNPRQEMILQARLGTYALQSTPPQVDAAKRAFERVLDLDSGNLAAENNLAYALTLLSALQEGDEKRATLQRAVELATSAYEAASGLAVQNGTNVNFNIVDTYAWTLASLAMLEGDTAKLEESRDLLLQARADSQESGEPFPELYYHLARVHAELGDMVAAREAIVGGRTAIQDRSSGGTPRLGDVATGERLDSVQAMIDAVK